MGRFPGGGLTRQPPSRLVCASSSPNRCRSFGAAGFDRFPPRSRRGTWIEPSGPVEFHDFTGNDDAKDERVSQFRRGPYTGRRDGDLTRSSSNSDRRQRDTSSRLQRAGESKLIDCLDSAEYRPMRHIPRSRIPTQCNPTQRVPAQLIPIERIPMERIAEPEGWADQIVACVRGSRCCADRDLSSPAAAVVTLGRR